MRKVVKFAILLCAAAVFSQKPESSISAYKFSLHYGIGTLIVPEIGGLNHTISVQLRNAKDFGFGLDFSSNRYESISFNPSPSYDEIINLDVSSNQAIPAVNIDGDNEDQLSALTLFVSKGKRFNRWFGVDLQVGPSIIFVKKQEFQYVYFPEVPGSFGGFFTGGGAPARILAYPFENRKTVFGASVKLLSQFKISQKAIIEVGLFTNFNKSQTISGLNISYVFGRGFKNNF